MMSETGDRCPHCGDYADHACSVLTEVGEFCNPDCVDGYWRELGLGGDSERE